MGVALRNGIILPPSHNIGRDHIRIAGPPFWPNLIFSEPQKVFSPLICSPLSHLIGLPIIFLYVKHKSLRFVIAKAAYTLFPLSLSTIPTPINVTYSLRTMLPHLLESIIPFELHYLDSL